MSTIGQWVSIVGRRWGGDLRGWGQYRQQQQPQWQQPPWLQQQQQQQPWRHRRHQYGQQYGQYGQQYGQYGQYGQHPASVSIQPQQQGGGNILDEFGSMLTHVLGEPGGYTPIPPRNALVQDPGPDRAGREVLPMSTGVAILPTQSAQITARPQRVAFRPERVFISAAGTSGGAADWVVNDIKIGNRSQFSQSGDVPGDMFATNAIDGFVSFETAQTAMDVVMVVTYIGLNESGVPFFASIVGTAAI